MRSITFCKLIITITIGILCSPRLSLAYSVLTHEAIVDVEWDKTIKPLLLEKFPGTSADQLKEAHAYAYGGSITPDMGYYPFGSKLFTELVHYVRTGDFVNNMLLEANDLNEYAFALGVLCHYNADKYGHPIAVNRCVPLVYPKDREKFGNTVTYEQDPVSHVRTEFGFDVLQTARGNYASPAYHAFIGFKVSRPLLERAFLRTYGINISDLFKDFSLSVESFRWIVKNFFPTITRTAWASKKAELRKANPSITRRKFEYRMHKANYYHEYGKKHERPGFFPFTLSLVIRVLPKVGPLKDLKIKIPGPDGEQLFVKSFDTTVVHFSYSLKKVKTGKYEFPNVDYDTGNDTWPGEYDLADKSYTALLLKLQESNFKDVDKALKDNVVNFYSRCNERMAAMAGLGGWDKATKALNQLTALKTN
jgi:hypothetical protein